MERAYFRPAYVWDCPNCGGENVYHIILQHPNVVPEEIPEELRKHIRMMVIKSEVKCKYCQEVFVSRPIRETDL